MTTTRNAATDLPTTVQTATAAQIIGLAVIEGAGPAKRAVALARGNDVVLRIVAGSVAAGMISYDRAVRRCGRRVDSYEVRVRNTAERHIDKATGGYRDERTGDIVVTCDGH